MNDKRSILRIQIIIIIVGQKNSIIIVSVIHIQDKEKRVENREDCGTVAVNASPGNKLKNMVRPQLNCFLVVNLLA